MKNKVISLLERRTARYISRRRPVVIVVTGSIGKTSTTQAIATVLGEKYKVLKTKGNYNTGIGVVMTIFGQEIVTSPVAWFWLCLKVVLLSYGRPKHEIFVLELGSDHPGEIKNFAYLKPDIAIVTAVALEHMEFFTTIEAVAQEELSTMTFSKQVLINKMMVLKKYVDVEIGRNIPTNRSVEYYSREDIKELGANLQVFGNHSLDAVAVAVKVADKLGYSNSEIKSAAEKITPQPGRMNRLSGFNGSTLIDDTYNSSPEAVRAALEYLYSVDCPQRVALLGNMNELGKFSETAHRDIGKLCDPKKLDTIFTLGEDANKYLAEEAEKRGCRVVRCSSPYQAGKEIKKILMPSAVVLLKGSQNGVYAEEATNMLLANPKDSIKLVRQGGYWPKKKSEQFKVD